MNLRLYFPYLWSGVDEIWRKGSEYNVEHLRILGKCIQRRPSFS